MKATKLARVLGALLFGGAVFNANAGSWTVTPDPATIGTTAGSASQTITIAFTGDGATQDSQIDFDFLDGSFTAAVTGINGGTCTTPTPASPGSMVVRVQTTSGVTLPGTPTNFCTVTFTATGANADTGATPEFTFPALNLVCSDNIGADVTPCTGTPIRLDVSTGPQAPTLTFAPPGGALTVTPNASGGTASIGVTAGAGTAGTTTALACSFTAGTGTATVT